MTTPEECRELDLAIARLLYGHVEEKVGFRDENWHFVEHARARRPVKEWCYGVTDDRYPDDIDWYAVPCWHRCLADVAAEEPVDVDKDITYENGQWFVMYHVDDTPEGFITANGKTESLARCRCLLAWLKYVNA